MKTRELRVIHGTQNSFYKKAFVKEDEEGTKYLYSYYSLIVTNYGKALKLLQSLFTWIFYLFKQIKILSRRGTNASILIHLDFLSI